MSLFLDTNALIWWLMDIRLTPEVKQRIAFEPEVMVSMMSPWEIWIKARAGKFPVLDDFETGLTSQDRLTLVSPTLEDARLAAALPLIHRDPFDRMIVAQAMNRRSILVTGDRQLGEYGVELLLV